MSKHLVDIDDRLLKGAQAAAGTKTIKATVEAALRQLAHREGALRHIKWLRANAAQLRDRLESVRSSRLPVK